MVRFWPAGAGAPLDGTRTVTVAVPVPPSPRVTEVGVTATTQPAGAPVAARSTAPLKRLEVRVTVNVVSVPSVAMVWWAVGYIVVVLVLVVRSFEKRAL